MDAPTVDGPALAAPASGTPVAEEAGPTSPTAQDDADAAFANRSDDDPAAVAAMREERASKRMRQTVRDMLISMLVVSGVVVLLVLPWNRGSSDPVRVVDPAPVVAGARAAEPWPVLAPQGLSADWRCTSARISTASDGQDVVRLGYVTPAATSAGLVQSATKEVAFVRDESVGGDAVGTVDVAGRTWQELESPDGTRRSLVRQVDGATYVVTGSASWADLQTFTASLVAG